MVADFVTSKSDVQLFPQRIKSQGKLTEKTAQAAALQTPPSIREQVEGNRFENKCVKKIKKQKNKNKTPTLKSG